MPYSINSKNEVVNTETGRVLGRHPNRKAALRQLTALRIRLPEEFVKEKHLTGKHDQSSHGRDRGAKGAYRSSYSSARQGGASVQEARTLAREASSVVKQEQREAHRAEVAKRREERKRERGTTGNPFRVPRRETAYGDTYGVLQAAMASPSSKGGVLSIHKDDLTPSVWTEIEKQNQFYTVSQPDKDGYRTIQRAVNNIEKQGGYNSFIRNNGNTVHTAQSIIDAPLVSSLDINRNRVNVDRVLAANEIGRKEGIRNPANGLLQGTEDAYSSIDLGGRIKDQYGAAMRAVNSRAKEQLLSDEQSFILRGLEGRNEEIRKNLLKAKTDEEVSTLLSNYNKEEASIRKQRSFLSENGTLFGQNLERERQAALWDDMNAFYGSPYTAKENPYRQTDRYGRYVRS